VAYELNPYNTIQYKYLYCSHAIDDWLIGYQDVVPNRGFLGS